MNAHSLRRSIVLCIAALLAVAWSGAALAAVGAANTQSSPRGPNLAGKWSGQYGGAYTGTFKLQWKQSGSTLRGSITLSKPRGTYTVTGSVHGSVIKFGAVSVGATYTGSVSGKTMSGSYKTPGGGGSWSAHKTS